MKITIIIPSFYPATVYGGPIFSTLHICQELVKLSNIQVYVSTTNTNRDSKLDVKTNSWIKFENNFYVKYYNETVIGKFSSQLYLNIWKDIHSADIVHIQAIFNTPIPISLLYATLLKKPILLSSRGALCKWCLEQGSIFKKLWIKLLIKPFAYSIIWHTTSKEEKNDILKYFPKAKVYVIPNGIEYKKFQKFNFLSKDKYIQKFTNKNIKVDKLIVSLGRLQKVKGFDILIEAFSKIQSLYTKSVLLIAGSDEGEKENLENLISKLNLQKKVFLIGTIYDQDKIDFLTNADLFVLPSHSENFGNVYLESLATGTPIVASKDTPWQKVEEYECGKWVENSVEDIAEAMIKMLKKDREQMRVNAKKLAKKYDWKNIALQFLELYKDMVKK